jgi:ribonucleoside-diphosphate reductase alpha chain
VCKDYGVQYLEALGIWDPIAPWAVSTSQLTVEEHIEDLKGFARWVDSACSKTVNLPYEYPYEDFKSLYLQAYNTGVIKGLTTYRAGTMTSVLSAVKETPEVEEEIVLEDIKLPDSLPASFKTMRAEGRKWYLTAILNENSTRPVALFVHTNNAEKNVLAENAVEKLLELARQKGIPEVHVAEVEHKIAHDTNVTKITRALGLNLRHGVLIRNIVSELDKVECFAGSFLFHIRKYLSTFIKDGEKVSGEKCPECGSEKIVYQEGCKMCISCGNSKCG